MSNKMKDIRARVFTSSALVIFLLSLIFPEQRLVQAQTTDTLIFDSSNHYLGACGYTDTTTFTLDKELDVSLFQVWYYWNSGEGPLAFTVKKDGADFLSGELTRSSCDPYQTSWCNGDLRVNKPFPTGSYEVKVANARKCAIPGGNGTVRLYGLATITPTIFNTPTIAITQKPTVTNVPLVVQDDCKVDTGGLGIIYPVAAVSALINVGFVMYFIKQRL